MPEIFVLSGPDVGRSFEVANGAGLGRSSDCAVRLRDKSISRQHAHLELVDERWYLVDDASRNGVFDGDERKDRVALEDGSEVRLGEVVLRFRSADLAELDLPDEELALEPADVVSDEIDLGDEIELEEDEEPAFVTGGGAGAGAPTSPPSAPKEQPARQPRSPREPVAPRPTGRILQYNKVEQRSGFLGADLAQYPFAVKALVFVLLGALFATLAWLAFRGTSAL